MKSRFPFRTLLVLAVLGMSRLSLSAEECGREGTAVVIGAETPVGVAVADTILTPSELERYNAEDLEEERRKAADTIRVDSSIVQQSTLTKKQLRELRLQQFVPNPKRALWLALVLPGAGQIYNRKYWKLPIFYGGFLGCTYAFLWNQQMYRDYSQAYLDIMDSDASTNSFKDFLPPNYDISGREEQFKTLFKNRRDRYRRYRDLSGFAFVGVYILSVIDAYVDAQLSVFDITPDLSLQLKPAVIPTTLSARQSASYGIGCSLTF